MGWKVVSSGSSSNSALTGETLTAEHGLTRALDSSNEGLTSWGSFVSSDGDSANFGGMEMAGSGLSIAFYYSKFILLLVGAHCGRPGTCDVKAGSLVWTWTEISPRAARALPLNTCNYP